MGGLPRKVTYINELKSEGKDPIMLDAGDLLFDNAGIPDYKLASAKYGAKMMLKGLEKIGYSAINVGSFDLALGVDYLKTLGDSSSIPLLSANLVNDHTGQPVFKPYIIVKRNGLRVGIVGLIQRVFGKMPGYRIKDMESTGRDVIKEIQPKTDVIVVLANVDQRDNKKLVDALPDADYIFVSRTSLRSRPGGHQSENGPLLYSASIEGKYVCDVELSIANLDSPIVDVSGFQTTLENSQKRLDRLQKKDPKKPLEEIYKDQPRVLKMIKNSREQIEIAKSKLPTAVNKSTFKLVGLGKEIKDDPEMLDYINKVIAKVKSLTGDRPVNMTHKNIQPRKLPIHQAKKPTK